MPFYLYTFRPQINDQELFEDFLNIFLPFINQFNRYSYSIEEDNTLSKHIHIMYEDKAKDNSQALPQKLNRKMFSLFKSALQSKMTNDRAFDDRKVKTDEDDYLTVLGYVNKETDCIRRKNKGFRNEEILEAVKYYYSKENLKASIYKKTDIILLTSKNIHIHIKNYCQKTGSDPGQWKLVRLKMRKENYCFSQVGHHEETFLEIEHQLYPERFPDLANQDSYSAMEKELKNMRIEFNAMITKLHQLENKYEEDEEKFIHQF